MRFGSQLVKRLLEIHVVRDQQVLLITQPCLHFLPDWYSGIFSLDPPGFGGVDGFPVHFEPGSNTPEPLLKYNRDHPIRCGAHIQKVVPSQSNSVDQILQ